MEIRTTLHFDKNLAKKLRKNPQLKNNIKKQVSLLKENLHHPSLKLHKLSGKRAQEYSFWIEGNLRITFILIEAISKPRLRLGFESPSGAYSIPVQKVLKWAVDNVILFTDVITHDEY